MNKALIFAIFISLCTFNVHAATRTNSQTVRQGAPNQRVSTTEKQTNARATTLTPRTAAQSTAARGATPRAAASSVTTRAAATNTQAPARATTARATTPRAAVSARAAIDETSQSLAATRTGAAYEQCKSAFFTCMDQFCTLKNDDYRRCSCSNRVYNLASARQTLQDAGEQLTVFTENLEVVGMTAAQATAMKSASEGENALTADTSASKALLQAIMNSIRGEDSNVGGKYSSLNSISLSFDTANAFGMTDAGQAIAKNNGQNLYTAVYPQCRAAVKDDCTDAALQRAVTAYLMAIEQDCNTLETAIGEKQKQMKSAIREGSAMLDLARVENRQKHNSSDIATCVAEIEAAVLSEEVCGAGYHKCLDNGEYIDISTGAPIAGVVEFYKLGELLQFADGVAPTDQKLTRAPANRIFVQNFEKRVKKFAQPALDKCVEQADVAWSDYLDKAMLDIFYAQQSKVDEIKQGCFDFVSACYMNGDKAITAAMKNLTGDNNIVLQPSKIVLNDKLCKDYVASCDNMFDGNIVQAYIDNRTTADKTTACRAIVKQCFDKYGGTNYENFYYPYSGLFASGKAPDWFTLYEIEDFQPLNDPSAHSPNYDLKVTLSKDNGPKQYWARYKSECAKQLTKIDACNDQTLIETVFGGFDLFTTKKINSATKGRVYEYCANERITGCEDGNRLQTYGSLLHNQDVQIGSTTYKNLSLVQHRYLRPTGVATEVYNHIVDVLATQCQNVSGRFVEFQFIKNEIYGDDKGNNICTIHDTEKFTELKDYNIGKNENMCPRDYEVSVDTQSWGACLCWENGGRRSKWGQSAKCVAAFPVKEAANDALCFSDRSLVYTPTQPSGKNFSEDQWCTVSPSSPKNQVIWPDPTTDDITNLPEGLQ